MIAVGNSDHLGVVVTKFTRTPKIKPKVVMKRSFKEFKPEDFLKEINHSNFNQDVTAAENIEEAAFIFENNFRKILDKFAPIKVFQMRKNYTPFLSDKTKEMIQSRNSWKELAATKGYQSAEKFTKELGKEIKKAAAEDKKMYFNKDFSECGDRSNAWKTAKILLGVNNNLSPTVIKVKDANGEVEHVTNPQKLAEMFNAFFKKKVEILRRKTDQPPVIPPVSRLREWLSRRSTPPPPFKIKEINLTELRRIMKKFKMKRTRGVDWIDKGSIKLESPLIEDSLLHLVNLSIRDGRFSDRWKPQLIFPHHKKKEKDLLENYRPVSHLVQVGMIPEYAVYFQIMEHFVRYGLFHQNHHGSVADHSTATALIQMFETWLDAAERQELSGVCLLDQSAAYDLLCHKTLREKLELYNFDQVSIAWLMSYLGGRTQQVQVESKTSSPLEVGDHAVPQGSILGGLLHVINSNDFPACHEHGESVVYVDDDSDTVSAKEQEQVKDLIEYEAGNSAQWLKDNRLCVAGSKSKLLVIGTSKLRASKITGETKIVVDNQEIVDSSSEKLLGVIVNNELTWKNHLYGDEENEGLIHQLGKRIGLMKMMARYMDTDNLKFFASGMFYSKMNYCLPVFGNVFGTSQYKSHNLRYQSFTVKDNSRLQVLQNNLNRVLLNARYDTPTEDLLKQTNSLSVQQMIAYHTTVLAYKIMKSGKPSSLAGRLRYREGGKNLRGDVGSIVVRGRNLEISREGFIYRASVLLNSIGEALRNEERIETFKINLRKWILQHIPIKPIPKFPRLEKRLPLRELSPTQSIDRQDIRNFLTVPVTTAFDSSTRLPPPPRAHPPPPTDRPPPVTMRRNTTTSSDLRRGIMRYFSPRKRKNED